MSTSDSECFESSDVENNSDNFNNSESHRNKSDFHQITKTHDNKSEKITDEKLISKSHENCQIQTEITNIEDDHYLEMKDVEHLTLNHSEPLPNHLNEIVTNEIQKNESTPIILNQRNHNLPDSKRNLIKMITIENNSFLDLMSYSLWLSFLLNFFLNQRNHNLPDSKRNLIKMITIENNSSNQGMPEKVKSLNKCYSVDNNEDPINKTESKNLFLDPDFQRKMKELYHPTSNSENYYRSKSSSEIKTDEKNNFNRSDSNCEIVEENFLPVSTTAKHLEHQLTFTSTSISPAMSPRIPKLTRFARLNRFLSVSPEPE